MSCELGTRLRVSESVSVGEEPSRAPHRPDGGCLTTPSLWAGGGLVFLVVWRVSAINFVFSVYTRPKHNTAAAATTTAKGPVTSFRQSIPTRPKTPFLRFFFFFFDKLDNNTRVGQKRPERIIL